MKRDDLGPEDDSNQLEPEDTLDDRGITDVLDEGYSPPDRPWAVDGFGVTGNEQYHGEGLDRRLARELPDVDADEERGDLDPDYPHDTCDTDGELLDDQVGDRRAGRLVAPDAGGVSDEDAEAWAEDIGINGGAASAEEAAVHIVDR